jgi:hypothetical protein
MGWIYSSESRPLLWLRGDSFWQLLWLRSGDRPGWQQCY